MPDPRIVRQPSTGPTSPYVPHDLAAPIQGAPTGTLAGLTAVVKDVFDIAGERTGAGSPERLATVEPASVTADAVQLVQRSGATITGKTVCDELVYSITGSNAHYGTPLNPRAPDRLPGGSSSGSASATASGACDLALGTDTGGSIRVPAAFCGLFGMRVTHGRISTRGVVPMAPSFDSVGFLANGAGVLRNVGHVLLDGRPSGASIDRVVLLSDLMAAADPDVAQAVLAFLARSALDTVPTVGMAGASADEWVECFRTIQGYETWASFGGWVTTHSPNLGPGIAERMRYASTITDRRVEAARQQRASIQAALDDVLPEGTIALMPTTPTPAPLLDTGSDELDVFRVRTMAFTCPAGLTGRPQLSMPIGLAQGAPVGVSLLGWRGGDEALLDFAAAHAVRCAA